MPQRFRQPVGGARQADLLPRRQFGPQRGQHLPFGPLHQRAQRRILSQRGDQGDGTLQIDVLDCVRPGGFAHLGYVAQLNRLAAPGVQR